MKTATTDTTISPAHIAEPHPVTDRAKLAALVASMASGGWDGRPVLAWRCGSDGEVIALTGSHRIAAARAAGLDEIPALIIEAEDDAVVTALEDCHDLAADLVDVLRECDVEEDAVALAEAEDYDA